MVHVNNPNTTEDDAYYYIRKELENLGWNIKNPAKSEDGEVYKQNECLSNNAIKEVLNLDKPEAIVLVNPVELWVIECKREKRLIGKALDEAKNQYAKKLNQSPQYSCKLISGVAGNDYEGFTVRTEYFSNGVWKPVLSDKRHKDTLLSREQANYLINNDTSNWQSLPDIPEQKYLQSAETINEILHNSGINKNKRARFIAGLILSLSTDNNIDLTIKDTQTLVETINSYINQKLREVKKENFFDYIKLELPPSPTNHVKYKNGIIETLKELQTLDIQNAMASGNDVLGKFYEKFLKYGNGAKEIGIVLTPRHITKFAVEVLNISYNDYVFDPTCGTGGFLVSAFDYVNKNSNRAQLEKFKKYNLFGIDQDDEVLALALVNMIFRGDGRNNMNEGNCFSYNIVKKLDDSYETGEYIHSTEKNTNPLITKVLMNPPFALKSNDEKEYKFISQALKQMQDGGILFSILPLSVMIERSTKHWRKDELLENNTLLSVITFPSDLFYPISAPTIGIIVKKGFKHPNNQNVLWIRAMNDGFLKKKGVRLFDSTTQNDFEQITDLVKNFINNPSTPVENIPEFQKACPINFDSNLELIPEEYLDEHILTEKEMIGRTEKLIRETVSFMIREGLE